MFVCGDEVTHKKRKNKTFRCIIPKMCVTSRCSFAAVAQLVEHQLPKLRVAGSSPVCRSVENSDSQDKLLEFFLFIF